MFGLVNSWIAIQILRIQCAALFRHSTCTLHKKGVKSQKPESAMSEHHDRFILVNWLRFVTKKDLSDYECISFLERFWKYIQILSLQRHQNNKEYNQSLITVHKLWCSYPTVISTTILELRLELGYSYKYASAARDRVCNWIFSHFRRLWCMYPSPSKWITISCGFSLSKHKLIAACLSLWSQDTNKESSQSKSATTFGWMDRP